MDPTIFRTINQFMPTYSPFAAGASAVNLAFGGGSSGGFGVGIEERFTQAQDDDARRRMAEMLRIRGGGGGLYGGMGGGNGLGGGGSTSSWMRSMPSLSFPSGGMM